jgi:mono/diheme cytochrome c family protein
MRDRVRTLLRSPFWQSVAVLAAAWLVVRFGIPYVPPLIGVRSAPVPGSVVLQYMAVVLVGLLLYVSADEERWRAFRAPIRATLVEPDRRLIRAALLVTVPLLVGFITYERVRPRVQAPPQLRSVHPAPPSQIAFQGRTLTLAGLENPLRRAGDMAAHMRTGERVYHQNCMVCHGDALDGKGHYAHGFNPLPLSFRDAGTIAQLTESFVFWRIAKGGPGLPREGAPWNSAMPAWEELLTEEEIWAVIIYIYAASGWSPRTWEEH